jgi:hypothetical protein
MHSQKIDRGLFKQKNRHLCGWLSAVLARIGIALTPEPIFI